MYNTGQSAVVVKDLTGKEYPAIAAVNRKRRVNGQREISLSFLYTDINSDFIRELDFHWKILFGGEWYTVINPGKQTDGDYLQVNVTAVLSFFVDLNGYYLQDKVENKSMTPANFFTELFKGTPYNFVLANNLPANTLSYEDNQSKTERFLYGIDRFAGEFVVRANTVYIHDLIGSDKDIILHEDLNVRSVSIDVDASGFHTWAKGFGDLPEQTEEGKEDNYRLEIKYQSPLAAKFGLIEGPSIKDGNYKLAANLTEAVKNQVENSYLISTEIDAIDLSNNGYPEMVLEEGDRVWLYVSKLNLNQQVRVVEIDETFDWEGNLINVKYTVGNEGIAERYKTQQYNTLKDFKDILSGKKKIAVDWLPDAIKRASDIINGNLDSHFKYGAGEIIGINRNNPNGYMRFNTDGLGFSRDGGKTYRSAITYEGIVADAITVGTLRGILIEGVEIRGSTIESKLSNTDWLRINGARLESRGSNTMKWRNENQVIESSLYAANGYFRIADWTNERSVFMTPFGLSTFADGYGDGTASGMLEFFSREYSSTNGITLASQYGVVGVKSSNNSVIIDAYGSARVESKVSPVYIRPRKDEQKYDMTFAFTSTSPDTGADGYLMYGNTDAPHVGLRFYRGGDRHLVALVDDSYARGGETWFDAGNISTNRIDKRDGSASVYWNGTGGGTLLLDNPQTPLIADGVRATSEFLYLGSDGGVKITNGAGHNYGKGLIHRPIVASEFNPASSTIYKQNITLFEESGVDIVKDHQVFTYFLEGDLLEGIYDNKQIGFIAEAAPMLRKGDTISHYKATSIAWKALQEIIGRIEAMELRLNDLEMVG